MAIQPHTPTPIALRLPNRTDGITTLGFVAVQRVFSHLTPRNGDTVTVSTFEIEAYFLLENDELGNRFESFKAPDVTLVADNNCLVSSDGLTILATRSIDPATGKPMREEELQEDFYRRCVALSVNQDTYWQGNAMEVMRENQPIVMGQLMRYHAQQAIAMGRFDVP
ncbi:hypothetical protein Q5H92_22850 [Hymenobacter sp. M29]|uniref:Uncharacterized protein n=1 Tax=Hymenobacter mellowenesis TaxID=3063995 RepID=A0ABT9AH67_9BACT|nr:hypothetical protein [Hymenobacter sp. M29]MDO7849221.1 hypothetical protein [Hymenobacter sp. M29]